MTRTASAAVRETCSLQPDWTDWYRMLRSTYRAPLLLASIRSEGRHKCCTFGRSISRLFSAAKSFHLQRRTMGEAEREGGRKLLKLNELFSGHSSHQSAMCELRYCDQTEYQSSSDIITKTGTGATSRASSIARATKLQSKLLPGPTESSICFLVREGWPACSPDLTSCQARLMSRRH